MSAEDDAKVAQAKAVKAAVAAIVRDVIGIAGVILCGAGGWMHYPPLGLILAGGMLTGLAVLSTVMGRR